MKSLLGATRSVDITPPVGLTLTGYAGRKGGSKGVKDRLFAKVLVLSDGINKIAIVSADLSAVDHNLTKEVRKKVESCTDIVGHSITVTASHTHSAPSGCMDEENYPWMNMGNSEADMDYYYMLSNMIADAIICANRDLEEVSIGVSEGSLVGLGSNRIDDVKTVDTSVNVIRIDNKDNEPIAIIVNYACHPTVLSAENYLISGDFPSYTMKLISRVYPRCEVMFLQGAAGDISTRRNRRESTFQEAKRFGDMLAGEVIKVMNQIEMCNEMRIKSFNTAEEVPVRNFKSDKESIEDIESARMNLQRLKHECAKDKDIRTAEVDLQGSEIYYKMKKSLKIEAFNIEMQIIMLGKTAILSIPGELFNEIGLKIKKLTDGKNVMVAGYANGYIGYILTTDYYDIACYESKVTMVSRDAEKIIINVSEKLLSMADSSGKTC